MLTHFKFSLALVLVTGMLTTATITAPLTKIFGKFYDQKKDFSCCKQNHLLFHHYYTVNVFWIEVANGYTEEMSAKQDEGACVIRCND